MVLKHGFIDVALSIRPNDKDRHPESRDIWVLWYRDRRQDTSHNDPGHRWQRDPAAGDCLGQNLHHQPDDRQRRFRRRVRPLTPDDALDRALELFVENDLLVLPVVRVLKQRQVIGMVHRHEIPGAYLRRVQGPVSTEGSPTP